MTIGGKMNTVFENKSIMDYVFENDTMMKKNII